MTYKGVSSHGQSLKTKDRSKPRVSMTERLSHMDCLKLSHSQLINGLGKGMSDDVTTFEEHI